MKINRSALGPTSGVPAIVRHVFVCVLLLAALGMSISARAESLSTFFGTTGQFVEYNPKLTAPNVAFFTDTGRAMRLQNFKGRALLVNIWATWCPPCVREMPELERLQEDLGGDTFTVVAISIDERGKEAVRPFFRRMGIDDLSVYLDPGQRTVYGRRDKRRPDAFPLYGLPISFFVDKQGTLVGYLAGSADWSAKDARAFIRHLAGH